MKGNEIFPLLLYYFEVNIVQLSDIVHMTRLYARDNNSYVFSDGMIKLFINQAIDRIKHYKVFLDMPYLSDSTDEPVYLPPQYHYMLALFAASRCFDHDERHYEGVEKRNEFEQLLADMIAEIQCGNLTITDAEGNPVEDGSTYIEYVKDEYFDFTDREVDDDDSAVY